MNFVKCPLNFGGREGIENSATPTQVSELCRCFPLAMQPPPALHWTVYKQKLQRKCRTKCDFLRAVIKVNFDDTSNKCIPSSTCNVRIAEKKEAVMCANMHAKKSFRDQPSWVSSHTAEWAVIMCSRSAVWSVWLSWRTVPCLRFAFRRMGYWEREERCRSTQIGGLRRAVQSPVYPKPFVVMCHTPARQYASWSGQQQTQLAEPRPRSLSFPRFPLLCRLQLAPPLPITHEPDSTETKTDLSGSHKKRLMWTWPTFES